MYHDQNAEPIVSYEESAGEGAIPKITRRSLLGLPNTSFIADTVFAEKQIAHKKRLVVGAVAGLMLAGINDGSLGTAQIETCKNARESCDSAVETYVIQQDPKDLTSITIADIPSTTISPQTTLIAEAETTTTVFVPETLTVTTETHFAAAANIERIGVAPETVAAIEAMSLTREGYQNFFSTINLSWFDYAQQFIEFNPEMVSNPAHYPPGREADAIPQTPTEWVTAHYTVGYYNEIPGNSHEPIGDVSYVNHAIDYQARERGIPCCGFNFLIDRNGGVYQLSPFWAKLRHNPPFDGRTTGFEIEAYRQEQITPAQYEAATYITIAMLQNEGLLGTRPIGELLHGHGDDRDTYREEHPEDRRWDQRNDFDRSLMEIWVPRIETFLAENPDISGLTQSLR